MIWSERDGEHTASAADAGIKVMLGVEPSGCAPPDQPFIAWGIVVDTTGGEEWGSWAPLPAASIEEGKELALAQAADTLRAIAAQGARAAKALQAMAGPVLLVGPPLPCDDPTEVRYAVHRGGRCVMAGTAPTVEDANRLAFG